MTSNMWRAGVLGAVIGALAGAAVTVGPARLELAAVRTQVATLERDSARSAFAQADANSEALFAAFTRSNALTRQLSSARADAAQLKTELQHAIDQYTDGRVCLHDPALRVLDRAEGVAVDLPGAAGGAAGADVARVATDGDIASWALGAGDAYAECVRRLDALISWHDGVAQ